MRKARVVAFCGYLLVAPAVEAQESVLDELLFEEESSSPSEASPPERAEAKADPDAQSEEADRRGDAALLPVVPVESLASESEGAATAPAPRPRSRLVEEIIVTAQKREEDIKDVPISISAFSAGQLDAKQVLNIGDLPKITPGLNITSLVGLTAFFLRGVGSDATVLGDPQVVTYVDNVYFPSGFGQLAEFGSIERIEVLKGPQGTLFGRNALGGAIRVQTRDPTLEAVEGSVSVGYGSFDSLNARAYVSLPIADTLAVAVSGLYKSVENHIDGRHMPEQVPLPKETQEGYRIKLLWAPAEWMDLRLNLYDISLSGAANYAVNTRPSLLGTAALIQPQDPRAGGVNETALKTTDITTYFGQFSLYTPWLDIKLLASEQELVDGSSIDFDGSPMPIAVFQSRGFSDATTAELQLLSNAQTPGSDWLEWVLGIYYYDALNGFNPASLTGGATDLTQGLVGGIRFPDGLVNLIGALAGTVPIPAGAKLSFVGQLKTESIAYYAQATAHLSDWASITLGARYQDEDRILDESSGGIGLLDGSRIVYSNYSGYRNERYRDRSRNLDPKVSLNIRPGWRWLGDDALLYASYQTATTSSTFNAINIYDAPEFVKATEIEAYEVGLKTRWFDGSMDVNAAIFDYDMTNPQVQTISLLAGGAVRFENAEGQRIRGTEFDTTIQLLPNLQSGDLILSLSGAWLDAVYSSFEDGSGFQDGTGVYLGGQDFTGNRVVRTPKYSAAAGLLQTFFLRNGSLELGLDYYYNDGFSYLAQGGENASEPSYTTLGANISYLHEPWNLRVSVFGRNLLRDEYNLSRFVNDFGTLDIIAPLDTYGARVDWEF
ncbi:MAG: TonB-dependent receptor [Pseudomonadota bacterium]|nr:TonB-dependent receptor [Pseudomonadota bacterium]